MKKSGIITSIKGHEVNILFHWMYSKDKKENRRRKERAIQKAIKSVK